MKRATHLAQGKTGLELLEEATQLLRHCSVGDLSRYYLGALPFVLCLLYFCGDMSRSPFADQHLAGAALGLAGTFLWMKFWQTVFARRLRANISGSPLPFLTWKQHAEVLIVQGFLQPVGLFLLPIALVLTVPFGWVFAFFQNLTVLDQSQSRQMRPFIRQAIRQAALWPGQNHVLLALLWGFGFLVFLNWTTVCYILPNLVKMLFGTESVFTRSSLSLLNTTFFAAMFGLSYLCVDPLLKATYALRCFYGQSLESGEDLKTELKPFTLPLRQLAALLLVFVGLQLTVQAGNQSNRQSDSRTVATQNATSLTPVDLDRAIQSVAQKRKYAWRMPREKLSANDNSHQGILDRFLERVRIMLRQWLQAFGNWLDGVLRRLFARQRPLGASSSGYGWILAEEVLLYGLGAAAVVGLVYAAYRFWRSRRPRTQTASGAPLQLAPDLADETVGAEQLPEDGWTQLGRELLARGELRLALRAFYLGSLAHLAQRNLINLAKFKSNRDYLLELQRRAHSLPDLLNLFDYNVSVFDRTWYGLHPATADLVNQFAANIDRMRTTK